MSGHSIGLFIHLLPAASHAAPHFIKNASFFQWGAGSFTPLIDRMVGETDGKRGDGEGELLGTVLEIKLVTVVEISPHWLSDPTCTLFLFLTHSS